MDRLRLIVAYVILGLWIGSIVLNAVDRHYAPPASIHILMVATATYLFGKPYIDSRREGDKE